MSETTSGKREPLPIAVLISGGGTTLQNLIGRIGQDRLDARIVLVISSRGHARGLEFAAGAAIPTRILVRRDFDSTLTFSETLFAACRQAGAELVVMGGFLQHVLVPEDFVNRVMNIHPGLIPAFCGQGFYGHHVHQAVLEYGAKISGCTVHFVDNQYDHGPIILQRAVPVRDDDEVDDLAARVFKQECEAYPQAIQWFAEGRLEVHQRRVHVRPGPAL